MMKQVIVHVNCLPLFTWRIMESLSRTPDISERGMLGVGKFVFTAPADTAACILSALRNEFKFTYLSGFIGPIEEKTK